MKISDFCYRAFGTCLVLVVAFSIATWIGLAMLWSTVAVIGIVGGAALVVGIIASIWE